MILFQLILVLFGLFMIYVANVHFRKKHLEASEFYSWSVVWLGFMFLTLWPGSLTGVAETLHIGRVFDLIVLIAFMILTILVFYNRVAVQQLKHKVDKLVQDRAIEKTKKRN